MPAGGLLTAAAITGAIGLGQTIYGVSQKKKAQREAAANKMPTYSIPGEEQSALTLAESQAGQGMSDASRAAYLNNAGSGLAATSNAILRGGGDANAIGSAYNRYETGINNQAIYDDQARMSHLSNMQSAFSRMSAQKDKRWQINEYQPWANKAQAVGQQLASSQNMITSGINTMGSALTSGLNGYLGRTRPLPATGGQQRENIAPLGDGSQQPQQQWQSYQQLPDQPTFPKQYGNGWNTPMAANQPGSFSFPSYYGMDYAQ